MSSKESASIAVQRKKREGWVLLLDLCEGVGEWLPRSCARSRPARQGAVLAECDILIFSCSDADVHAQGCWFLLLRKVTREPLGVVLTTARLLLFTGLVGFEAAGDEVVGRDGGSASDLWHEGLKRLGRCVSVDGCEHVWSGDVVGVKEKEREGVE